MYTAARHLALHGTIVLLFGLLLGGPYAKAIKRGAPVNIVNSWRVAHLSLPIGATLMLAVAALLPSMTVPTALAWVIAVAFIVSAYGFCVSTPLAALTGERGLSISETGSALWHPSSELLHWSSPRSCLCRAGSGPDRLKTRVAAVIPDLIRTDLN